MNRFLHSLQTLVGRVPGPILRRYRVWLGVILLALVLAAGYFVYSTRNTIVIRDDGFHPRTLTIRAGETVTFRSERGKYFWPASDFHPSHMLFPAFDAKKAIDPKGSWSFRFDMPGVYPFHDHLAAYYFGVIRVADASGKVTDNCMEHGGQLQCWQNEVFTVLAKDGLNAAFELIDRLYADNDSFSSMCHTITHNIGHASYQLYVEDPKAILSPKAMVCGGGFYHGFMEAFLSATADPKKAATVCEDIGKAIGKQVPDARLQCYHGIGHGALETMIASTGDFGSLVGTVNSALAICEEASIGVDERYRCVSGLYNGISNAYVEGQYGLSASSSDPLALCAVQKDEYKESCYGNMNTYISRTRATFLEAARYVLAMPDVAYRESTLKYLAGLESVPHLHDTSFDSIVTECEALPKPFDLTCLQGFVHGFIEHGLPEREYVLAISFCASPAMDARERGACYQEALGHLSGSYSKETATAVCNSVAPELRHYCAQ